MFETEVNYIDGKIEQFIQKIALKKPARKITKEITPPASSNCRSNKLFITQNLLQQLQTGVIEPTDIDAILAHEFGHLLDYRQKTRFKKTLQSLKVPYIFLVIPIGIILFVNLLFACFFQSFTTSLTTFLISVAVILVLFLFSSTLMRPIVEAELAADRYAISFHLIEPQQMADFVANWNIPQSPKKVGMRYRIDNKLNLISHPTREEQLQNIGFEIEYPIKTKKM